MHPARRPTTSTISTTVSARPLGQEGLCMSIQGRAEGGGCHYRSPKLSRRLCPFGGNGMGGEDIARPRIQEGFVFSGGVGRKRKGDCDCRQLTVGPHCRVLNHPSLWVRGMIWAPCLGDNAAVAMVSAPSFFSHCRACLIELERS